MQRRHFITLLGGTVMVWPLTAHAQQGERVRRIGVLIPFTADDPEAQARTAWFEQSLRQLGWTVGQNLQIEQRLPGGEAASIRHAVAELVALGPDVLLVIGTGTASLLLQATQTIPVVFVNLADPVGAGFVQSLARPGATPLVSRVSNIALAGNGSNCLNKLPRK